MKKLLDIPKVLLRKIILTALIGIGILIAGISASILFDDRILLLLTLLLSICCILNAILLFHRILGGGYSVLEGKCTCIAPISFTHYVQITIDDVKQGPTQCRLLKAAAPAEVGMDYRLYFSGSNCSYSQNKLLAIESAST